MRKTRRILSTKTPVTLAAVKRWLNVHEDDKQDDDLLENQIIPASIELYHQRSGRILGIAEIEQIYDRFPGEIEFDWRPVREVCGIWYAKDSEAWTQSPSSAWVSELKYDHPRVRLSCVGGCDCPTCQCLHCECPTKWRVVYHAGQVECEISALDSAWVNMVVAEMYRVREASLETRFTNTSAFARIDSAIRSIPEVHAI